MLKKTALLVRQGFPKRVSISAIKRKQGQGQSIPPTPCHPPQWGSRWRAGSGRQGGDQDDRGSGLESESQKRKGLPLYFFPVISFRKGWMVESRIWLPTNYRCCLVWYYTKQQEPDMKRGDGGMFSWISVESEWTWTWAEPAGKEGERRCKEGQLEHRNSKTVAPISYHI